MTDEKRGPGRPKKYPGEPTMRPEVGQLDKVTEVAADLGLEHRHTVEVQGDVAKVTLEVIEYWTITPTGRRKKVRRRVAK